MRKFIYYLSFVLLLYIISILPVSAQSIKMCTRSEKNLHVRENFINDNNIDAIMATPCVDASGKIYDFANLLTDSEEEKLYNEVESYIEKTKYDIAIVTTDENNKRNEVEYADDFYDYNEFGYSDTRDGVLLLIDMDNRKVYISTTGYAIKIYDDSRIDSVIDSGYDDLKAGNYYQTFSSMIASLSDYFDQGASEINEKVLIDEFGKPYIEKNLNYFLIAFLSLIVTSIISTITYFKSRLKIKVASTISYLKDKNINLRNDILVNSVVTKHYRNTDSGGSGGNHAGGSSYHSSSSGSFHGGGGRGF